MCVCVCVCVCACACARAYVCVCACVCVQCMFEEGLLYIQRTHLVQPTEQDVKLNATPLLSFPHHCFIYSIKIK